MGLLRTFGEEVLLQGVEVQVYDSLQEGLLKLSLKLIEEANLRRRVEMTPAFDVIDFGIGAYTKVFDRVGQIIADPDNVKPERPVGHVFADHTKPTTRWSDNELQEKLQRFAELDESDWVGVREDGGSFYYMLTSSTESIIRQVVKSSGRTMIGEIVHIQLPVEWGQSDVIIGYDLLKRLVVKSGEERSPVGSTNYDFVRFAW